MNLFEFKNININNNNVTKLSVGDVVIWEKIKKPFVKLLMTDGTEQIDYYDDGVIPEKQYYGMTNIQAVELGDGITTIDKFAFRNCSGLTSVVLSDSVTSISSYAFDSCSSLMTIEIGTGLTTVGKKVSLYSTEESFNNCTGLTKVIIKDLAAWCNINFAGIYSNPLYYAKHLYLNDEEITDLVIPNSVTSIGNYAFINCNYLTSVTIHNSVTSIGSMAFSNCSGLTKVEITDLVSWCNINFGYVAHNPLYYAHHLYMNGTEITDLVIPDSVIKIPYGAFYSCYGLTSVLIPSSVTNIDVYAFQKCSGLTSVSMADSVTNIAESAFQSCSNLTSVEISSGVTKIEYNTFNKCSHLSSITANAETQPTLETNSFSSTPDTGILYTPNSEDDWYDWLTALGTGWTQVKKVPKPKVIKYYSDGVEEIDEFEDGIIPQGQYSGQSFTSVTIGSGITTISPIAFRGSRLFSVNMSDSVTTIANYAFQNCITLSEITIPSSVTSYSNVAFSGCSTLTSVTWNPQSAMTTAFTSTLKTVKKWVLGDGIPNIGTGAFSGTSISSITIPDSVTSISNYAFQNCKGLSSIEIPDSVTSIGTSTFSGCTKLSSVKLSNKIKTIGSGVFYGCTGLTSIEIPDSVTSIGNSAFQNCSGLTSMDIPDSVTGFGTSATCMNCKSLTSVTLSNNIKTIPASSFSGCTSLTSIVIPDSVTTIENTAFAYCSKMQEVTIGKGLTSVKNASFSSDLKINKITVNTSTEPTLGTSVFPKSTSFTGVLYTPYSTTDWTNWLTALGEGWTQDKTPITD